MALRNDVVHPENQNPVIPDDLESFFRDEVHSRLNHAKAHTIGFEDSEEEEED
jgi:hypothetical protein